MDPVSPTGDKKGTSRLVEHWDGHDYERHSSHQRKWGTHIIQELALRGDERILDLGCGDGTLTCELAGLVPRGSVVGVDAAPEMLEAARAKCGTNMEVAVLDINTLDFRDAFDVVFSNAALHWIHDHAAVLRNVHRALRPGGILRAQFGGAGNCPNLLGCVQRQMAASPFLEAFTRFHWPWYFPSLTDYEQLLSVSPFTEWRAWLEPKDQHFPSAEALVGWIDNPCLIPFLQPLPAGLRSPFRDAVVADMLARTRQPNGAYLEPFRRMNLWARKMA